jgi:hypothetical protein
LGRQFYSYNPSDLAYHPELDRLITVGPNSVTFINVHDFTTENTLVKGDFEGVSLGPKSRPDYIYLADEYPSYIYEYDFQNKQVNT